MPFRPQMFEKARNGSACGHSLAWSRAAGKAADSVAGDGRKALAALNFGGKIANRKARIRAAIAGAMACLFVGFACSAPASVPPTPMIIDSHIHLWTLPRADGADFPPRDGRLPWLQRDCAMDDYRATGCGERVDGVVLVESSVGLSGEALMRSNRLMLEEAERDTAIVAVVGKLDLLDPEFEARLAVLAESPLFAGLRVGGSILEETGNLRSEARAALGAMAERGLAADTLQFSLPELAALAPELPPGLAVVANHLGRKERRFEVEEAWLEGLRAVAPYPSINVKISDIQQASEAARGGEGVLFAGETDPEPYRPLFEALYAHLGPDRLIFGTNWPVSDSAGECGQQIAIVEALLADKGPAARRKILGENAARVYGIEADPAPAR